MTDYGALADKLSATGLGTKPAEKRPEKSVFDVAAFFERIKAQILEELKQANAELGRRGLATIEPVFLPSFAGRYVITFGTVLLCAVEPETAKGRFRCVIYGPPNRQEIARKYYPFPAEPADAAAASGKAGKDALAGASARIAGDIVSEILESGIRMSQAHPHRFEIPETAPPLVDDSAVLAELWISLASLLTTYTVVHGFGQPQQATVKSGGDHIQVEHLHKRLDLKREGAVVTWKRENGSGGIMQLTEHGRLRSKEGEKDLDMAAESWARELMETK